MDFTANDILTTDNLVFSLVNEPTRGQLTQESDGTFTYVPRDGFVGVETFQYSLCNPNCEEHCVIETVTIVVGGESSCIPPSIITPNNDGANDTFIVPCLNNYEGSRLIIINRWGDQVYNSDDYKNDWNGTYNGKDLPVGTYYYILLVNDGNQTEMAGYVFIQRE